MDIHIPTNDGYWVSENFQRLAEVIKDYSHSKNSDLELRWIPPTNRETPDEKAKPFCVFDSRAQRPIFFASEFDTPETILTRLFDSDNTKGDVLKRIDAHNAAVKALKLKEQMEKLEDANDRAMFMIGSPLNYMRMRNEKGELIKYDDERRRM